MSSADRHAGGPMICGITCACGPNDEPLACGYQMGHAGPHAWSSLPTFIKPQGKMTDSGVFSVDDGGDGPWWLSAEDHTAFEAVQAIDVVSTDTHHGFSVRLVRGHIENVGLGEWSFRRDEAGDTSMWEVAWS